MSSYGITRSQWVNTGTKSDVKLQIIKHTNFYKIPYICIKIDIVLYKEKIFLLCYIFIREPETRFSFTHNDVIINTEDLHSLSITCLTTKSCEVLESWDWVLKLLYCSEIWLAFWHHCYWDACQMAEWLADWATLNPYLMASRFGDILLLLSEWGPPGLSDTLVWYWHFTDFILGNIAVLFFVIFSTMMGHR